MGITAPKESAALASVQPARIERILVPEGGVVRRGEIVVQLDERAQGARAAMAKAAAESTLSVEHARARWEKAQRDLDRLRKLRGDDFASSKETSDALAEEQITRIEYELANFNQAQAARAMEREQAALEEFRLRAPFDGVAVQHLKHPGETVNEMEAIVALVQLDPMLVLVDCPSATAAGVATGERFQVQPTDLQCPTRIGVIVFISPVVDGGSQTQRVKLSIDNADGMWLAGMKVHVDFSAREPKEPR